MRALGEKSSDRKLFRSPFPVFLRNRKIFLKIPVDPILLENAVQNIDRIMVLIQ
jgi:hypothetical protein